MKLRLLLKTLLLFNINIIFSQHLIFDGTDDYVEVPYSSDFNKSKLYYCNLSNKFKLKKCQ